VRAEKDFALCEIFYGLANDIQKNSFVIPTIYKLIQMANWNFSRLICAFVGFVSNENETM
jgi:hypothetical protein